MKVIIAGSRDITDIEKVASILTEAFIELKVEGPVEIVSGCAKGVDFIGETFANFCEYDLKRFPADWATHGKAAGPIRNKQMAEYADAAIVIHNGSRGSLNMIEQMRKLNKPVFVKEV